MGDTLTPARLAVGWSDIHCHTRSTVAIAAAQLLGLFGVWYLAYNAHMKQRIDSSHETIDGKPAGGTTCGVGLNINWQNGPLGRDGERKDPNGAFVETVIAAAVDRLEHYQRSQFKCRENALAITKLEEALHWLQHRTENREARQVEGTHAV